MKTKLLEPRKIGPGQWVGEAALLAEEWHYVGMARAAEACSLGVITATHFRECVRANRSALIHPSQYAQLFVEHLNGMPHSALTDILLPGVLSFAAEEGVAEDPARPDLLACLRNILGSGCYALRSTLLVSRLLMYGVR